MAGAEVMTVRGTVNKTALALLLLFITASFVWNQATAGAPVGLWIGVGVIGGLITALITVFKRTWAPITTPAYAALEGLALTLTSPSQIHDLVNQSPSGLGFAEG